MSSSDESIFDGTPPSLKAEADLVMKNLLPKKSRDKYNRVYDQFMSWKESKHTNSFSESVFLAYFSEQSKNKKPSTLWAIYSMLKCTVNIKHNIDIKHFTNLTMFLKRQSAGYKSKKSKVLTGENVDKFLKEAPDAKYLAVKVALIMGLNGACRSLELTNITMDDIESHDQTMIVKLCDTKTKIDRVFVIRGEYLNIVRKYIELRPPNTNINRFFLNYKEGKCTRQPIGKNKISSMPKEIAAFLKLADAELYTGHCFRRTSATLLADSGANLTTVKRLGGWKSDKVAEGYIEDSIENKSEITKKINDQIRSCQHLLVSNPQAGTSGQHQLVSSPHEHTVSSSQAGTSRQYMQVPSTVEGTSRNQQVSGPRLFNSQSHLQAESCPLVTLQEHLPTTASHETSQTPSSEVQQTNINVPGKGITFSFTNCPNMSNITFNIN